jgi:hypothetical protein
MAKPKKLIDEFFPGFESGQMEVGLANLGISVVTATLACNTARTAAEIIASPPNTGTGVRACGPIVHSLGAAPTLVLAQLNYNAVYAAVATEFGWGVSFQYVTADNSAVYIRAATWTGTNPVGVPVKVFAVR